MERASDFRFLGTHIMEDLTWTVNYSTLQKKAQQRLYFLRILRKNNLQQTDCWCSIESAVQHLHRCRKGEWADVLSHPWRIYTTAAALRGPTASLKTHPTHHLFEFIPSARQDDVQQNKQTKKLFIPEPSVQSINAKTRFLT